MGKLIALMVLTMMAIYFVLRPPVKFLTDVKTKSDQVKPHVKEVKDFIKSGEAFVIEPPLEDPD